MMQGIDDIGSFSKGEAPHRNIRIAAEYAPYDLQEPFAEKDKGRYMLAYAVNIPYEGPSEKDKGQPYHDRTQCKEQCEPEDDIFYVRRLVSQLILPPITQLP